MESKYYTPTIEEWHVDFEYEQRREIWDRSYPGIKVLEYIWEPVIGNLGQFKEGIDPDRKEKHYRFTNGQLGFGAYSNMVRVKYLDKEDIESLGWKFNDNMSVVSQLYYLYEKDGYDLSVWYRKEGLLLVIRKVNKSSDNIVVHSHSIFYGYIKNKSELKTLLKQLRIE